MSSPLLVVKVGGSLYDLPDLATRINGWLDQAGSVRTLLVPGGGPLVDVVRALDRTHRLGEEASHWLALHALSVNARFLARLLPGTPVLPRLPVDSDGGNRFILDPLPFFENDDRQPDRLPHSWQVTSDSLAVHVANRASAAELVLLKSRAWPSGERWAAATREGFVDGFFEEALSRSPGLRVRVVNLRALASRGA